MPALQSRINRPVPGYDPQSPVRLLHVFSTFSVGGPQIRFVQLAAEFDATVEHVVLAMDGRYECLDLLPANANVKRSLIQPTAAGLPKRLRQYRQELAALRPDRLVTYNWGAIEWAAANYWPLCPHIHIEDGFGPEEADGQIRRRVLFRRLVLSGHSRVVVPSRTLYDIARAIWRLPEARLSYIPNGIELEPFGSVTRQEARSAFALPQNKLIVGTLATLRPEKNLHRLVDASKTVREAIDCHLVIAGEGKERASLEAHVADLGLADAVSFTGFVAQPHTLLPAFDVFALSSDTEQMPLSVMEAMAAGLPIASLDVGDVRQMVAEVGKGLVRGKDKVALSESLLALIGSPELRASTGEANRVFAERNYDVAEMLASWKELFLCG